MVKPYEVKVQKNATDKGGALLNLLSPLIVQINKASDKLNEIYMMFVARTPKGKRLHLKAGSGKAIVEVSSLQ